MKYYVFIPSFNVTSTDHASFWNYGFPVIGFGEVFYGGDANPYYHISNDRINHFNPWIL